jgi:hypothetical protein
MKQKLAILGASYLQIPLFLKAKQMGLETHCFAWSEGAVCKEYSDFFYPISILDKELILDKCKEIIDEIMGNGKIAYNKELDILKERINKL